MLRRKEEIPILLFLLKTCITLGNAFITIKKYLHKMKGIHSKHTCLKLSQRKTITPYHGCNCCHPLPAMMKPNKVNVYLLTKFVFIKLRDCILTCKIN